MRTLTRRSVPALFVAASTLIATRLNAGPAIDPIYAAIDAVKAARMQLNIALEDVEACEGDYRRHVNDLPKPEHAGVHFTNRDGVDKFFDAPSDKRVIALAIRDSLAAAAGMDDLAEKLNPSPEAEADRLAREVARAQVHKHMTTYLRCKDELRRTSGLAAADRSEGIAAVALEKAEKALSATTPTTLAGAQTFAVFAASYCEMDMDTDGAIAALRSVAACLSQSV